LTPADFKRAGYSIAETLSAGYSLIDLKISGYSYSDFIAAGYNITTLKKCRIYKNRLRSE
jgi:hypothetical protein